VISPVDLTALRELKRRAESPNFSYVGRAQNAEEWITAICHAAPALFAELEALRAEVARLRKGIAAVSSLIDESRGVTGLHLNGDEAPWDELRTGGRFEEWLLDFDAALERGDHHADPVPK
jgi:hypothetical protein